MTTGFVDDRAGIPVQVRLLRCPGSRWSQAPTPRQWMNGIPITITLVAIITVVLLLVSN